MLIMSIPAIMFCLMFRVLTGIKHNNFRIPLTLSFQKLRVKIEVRGEPA